MRAVIYTRVSKDRRDRASVERQENEAREAATSLGWDVIQVFTDNDVSASRHARIKEREQHTLLLDLLRSGAVDVLVMWESSRGDRKLTTWSGLLDLCRDIGVMIHIVDHHRTYDLSVPRDWKTLADEGVNNAYASEETRERVLSDVRANAVKGRPHGKLPYGYGREYDDRGLFVRQYVKEDQAEVVREAARRTLAGDSLYSISADLNLRGVPAPRGGLWIATQVKRLLTNPRYIGQRVFRGQVIGQAIWPAILDEGEFLECRAILTDPRRNTIRDRSLKHLLSGIARCAVCGSKMRVWKNRGYLTYICQPAAHTAARSTKLEEFIVAVVVERLSRPDFVEALAARQQAQATTEPLDEAKALRERLDGFYASAAAGEITPGALGKIEARLLGEIEVATTRRTAARVPAVLRRVAGPDIAARWDTLEIGTRREIIDMLLSIRINPTVRGTRFTPERVTLEWKAF